MNRISDCYESFVVEGEFVNNGRISDTTETPTVICEFIDKLAKTYRNSEDLYPSDLTETETPKF